MSSIAHGDIEADLLALEQIAKLIDAPAPEEGRGVAVGSQHAQQFRENSAAEQKALAPPLVGAAQVLEPRSPANLLADSDRCTVLQYIRKPRRVRLVAG